jgi:nicotinamidase-related amidase
MLTKENAVLVIIDVQGKLATLMHEKEQLYKNVTRMIEGCKTLAIPVLWNEQLPQKLGPTIPEIKALLPDQRPIEKNCFSCYGNDAFRSELEKTGRRQVLLVGIETHVCVYQSAVDLIENGYEVHLVVDAVSSRTPQNHELGIDKIRSAGARLTSVEMALFEMLRIAEGPEFREIIKIVK